MSWPTFPDWLVDVCAGIGAASLTFTGCVLVWCVIKTVQDRRAGKPPVEGWDLEPWVENPPYAERSCHPLNVDIDCGQCRRWLAARNNPPAGVS